MTESPGLRERKKRELRAALSQTSWALMLEQGIDAVTPDRVAEKVGVSGRTFYNYFASREEAIIDAVVCRVVLIPEAIRSRPPGEAVWDSLIAVLPDAIAGAVGDREGVAVLFQAARRNPALRAQHQEAFDRIQREFIEVIAERTGRDPAHDLVPGLLGAAARSSLGTPLEIWALGDGVTALPDLVRASLTQLRTGIPVGNDAALVT